MIRRTVHIKIYEMWPKLMLRGKCIALNTYYYKTTTTKIRKAENQCAILPS